MRKLRHPNLVLFMGSCVKMPCTLLLVTELMTRGNLFEIYHQEPRLATARAHYKRVADVSIDMCKGMCALHHSDPPLLHRDLKSPNIFVDQHWVAKIGDFGLAKMKSEGKTMTAGVGSPLWIAPEVLKGERFGEGCDIYSFAIILWEMAAWCEPYEGLNSVEVCSTPHGPRRTHAHSFADCLFADCLFFPLLMQVTRGVVRGMRPRVPDDCPPELGHLMEQCWQEDHLARPPFDRVLDVFEKFSRSTWQEEASPKPDAIEEVPTATSESTAPAAAQAPTPRQEIRRRKQQELERKKQKKKKAAGKASPKAKPSPKTATKPVALPPVRDRPQDSRRGSVTNYPKHLEQWDI